MASAVTSEQPAAVCKLLHSDATGDGKGARLVSPTEGLRYPPRAIPSDDVFTSHLCNACYAKGVNEKGEQSSNDWERLEHVV